MSMRFKSNRKEKPENENLHPVYQTIRKATMLVVYVSIRTVSDGFLFHRRIKWKSISIEVQKIFTFPTNGTSQMLECPCEIPKK